MQSMVHQRLQSGWKSLGIDMKTLYLMLKGSIPVAISLAIYQSTPVSETFTSLGFLVAIIAVVTVNLLPRAELIQMTFSICTLTAVAIPLAMLATWSGLQARFHTDPQGLHKYNSSQSAITGVWLFFHIWLSNSIQARYPALLIPTILYNIFMIVQFTSCSRFSTWAECWDLIYLTVRCYYSGVAISFVSGIIIYPVTCRSEIFEVQEKYIHAARGVLNGTVDYLVQLSKPPATPSLSSQHSSTDDSVGPDAQIQAGNALKQQMAALKALYIKMHQDLIMAKREVAWGKLSARDINAVSDLFRRVLMPIGGMSHIPDILQRIEEDGGWEPLGFGHHTERKMNLDAASSSEMSKNIEYHESIWRAAVGALIEPATTLIEAVNDGLEHAGLQLEIIPRPGTKNFLRWMPGAQRNDKTDADAKGEVIAPGDSRFSQLLEDKLNEFSVSRDRQMLYLILYMQQMLYSTGVSVLELCKFSDRLVSEGVMSRNRLIIPSVRRLRNWLLSIFDTADAAIADDDRPSSKKEAKLLFGKSTQTTRNIEHLPPQTAYARFGVKIRRFQDFLKGPEFGFGFRSACAAMSCAIVAYLHPTQDLFTHYRLIWSVIIAAIVLSIGYLTEVNKSGIAAATAHGVIYYRPYEVAAMRVACVLWGTGASIFFTYLPYSITARGMMRKDMAVVMHLIANYHTVVHSTLKARLRGTEGDMADKNSQGHVLSRTRKAMFNNGIELLGSLLDYVALISYSTQAWSINGPHTQYFHHSTHTREWMLDLAKLIGPANASTAAITAVLYQLSGAVSTGRSLPSKFELAKPYQLSQTLRHLDPAILHSERIPDLGYSTFAVVELMSKMIVSKIKGLTKSIEALVGVAYFDVGNADFDNEKME
ncbi:hypothetical protein LTR36_001478 [Oleoguttula mirabilis]|uniref:Putative ER transporter 6TM N-terminal domain-containing protein n=1 Tax=Oleoguttula mirabilis TaxID=1507867 RepID=A0AAV9JMX6_9PEZI|nr:hypothetical protein LTR36_001478 [Oleoguttula mirabilis]